jgi:hypothetical protein
MRSECSFPVATVTFLGEHQDITDPEAAVLVAGQTTERRCSVRRQLGVLPMDLVDAEYPLMK